MLHLAYMDLQIVNWCRRACRKFQHLQMGCYYTPNQDQYHLHINGKAVMVFTGEKFYEIDKNYRYFKMLLPLIKVGMWGNMSNADDQNLINDFKTGIKIV